MLLAVPVGRENAVGAVQIERRGPVVIGTRSSVTLPRWCPRDKSMSVSARALNRHEVTVYYRSACSLGQCQPATKTRTGTSRMRAVVVTTASAINPSPRMQIITSVFSRLGICFEGFMVLRLLAPAHGGRE